MLHVNYSLAVSDQIRLQVRSYRLDTEGLNFILDIVEGQMLKITTPLMYFWVTYVDYILLPSAFHLPASFCFIYVPCVALNRLVVCCT